RGFHDLFAPVRPSRKSEDPWSTMADYASRTREDGLPVDPWLRVHVRAGGRIVRVCPASMVIAGSLAQWREWTALPFDTPGPVVVPGATAPVHVDVENDHAVYVEANVWVHHRV
ncbi:MAG TPA: N-acetyltransferase, partial [Ornithinicoccus sp.]|nr:N-acetyltransferase [Ornithinicoccus sp.]